MSRSGSADRDEPREDRSDSRLPTPRADSPYSRLNYRRLIAWPERIRREWPFLAGEIDRAPERSVIDLGCGTGEHARHLASQGIRALGVDRSSEQIAKARDFENEFPAGPTFVEGDLTEVGGLTSERFGLALCLGNVLPHLEDRPLEAMLQQLGEVLLPSGRLLIQLLNYERIFSLGIRHLPINFRENPETQGEIAFVRLLRQDRDDPRYIWFYPLTLAIEPETERPIELEAAKEVRLRAWRRPELEAALDACGFAVQAVHGDMAGGAYEAETSPDLTVTAIRRSDS